MILKNHKEVSLLGVEQCNKEEEKSLYLVSDDDLLELIKQDNNLALDHLLNRYKRLVESKARMYFLVSGDQDDIIQEGMIGLYKAIINYDKNKLTSFKGFAILCITRHMITAIKTATRKKHTPLNTYVSLDKTIYNDDTPHTLMDIIAEPKITDPQILFIHSDQFTYVRDKLSKQLTLFEKSVLLYYLEGCSYEEISDKLNRPIKSIDNAIQRVKRKIELLLEAIEYNS